MHQTDDAATLPKWATQPRLWSYEALRQSQVWVPVRNDHRDDLTRIGSIALPYWSPEHGDGFVSIQAPGRREISRWLYGVLAISSGYLDRYPERARKVDRVYASFISLDRARREFLRPEPPIADATAAHRRARLRRQRANRDLRRARRRLQSFLQLGLAAREGTLLQAEESVWIHLVARDLEAPGLRVCEQCALVFPAPRAERCDDCRRSPVRINVRPTLFGGWHVAYRVGHRWAADRFDRTVYYTGRCTSCNEFFESADSRQRLCRNCGIGSGRVRRHRGSISRRGRRRYRYVNAGEAPLVAVSAARGPNGRAIELQAVDGVVETDDAEVARVLDENTSIRRLEDLPIDSDA